MSKPAFVLCLAFAGSALGAGCASSEKPTASASARPAAHVVNRMCPVGGHAVEASSSTVQHKGQTVAFCCEDCIPVWNAMASADKDAALKKALAAK